MSTAEIPLGLVGTHPRIPIGVHVSAAITGENGAPSMGGRFWLMSEPTQSRKFGGGGGRREWSRLTRSPHPRFREWNAEAFRLGNELDPQKGAGRVGMLRGNLVHARLGDAAMWNRAAQKLPEPNPNPSLSRRPACEGNGIWARRFKGNRNGEEIFEKIPCPNRLCQFAESGACKPDTHLYFRLRWNREDAFEAPFPELLAHFHTGGWESTEGLMGLFEYVLGTAMLLSADERAQATEEERAGWRPGFAEALGLKPEDVSLVGMPFSMSIHYRTKGGDDRTPAGKRFPVVSFSTDGDLEAWLVSQAQTRHQLVLLAGGRDGEEPRQIPAVAASVADSDFIDVARHESRVELLGIPVDDPPAAEMMDVTLPRQEVKSPLDPGTTSSVKMMQPARIEYLRRQAEQLAEGNQKRGAELLFQAAMCFHSSGDLSRVLASQESEVLRKMRELAAGEQNKGVR